MAKKKDTVRMRGFIHGQIVDAKTGRVVGDTGLVKNVVVNQGRTSLACYMAGVAGSSKPTYAVLASSEAVATNAVGFGTTGNSFKAFDATGTSGTGAFSCSCSFAGSNGSLNVGAAGIFMTNNNTALFAGQSFTSSAMATNQNFNLTYSIQVSTA